MKAFRIMIKLREVNPRNRVLTRWRAFATMLLIWSWKERSEDIVMPKSRILEDILIHCPLMKYFLQTREDFLQTGSTKHLLMLIDNCHIEAHSTKLLSDCCKLEPLHKSILEYNLTSSANNCREQSPLQTSSMSLI